MGSLENIEFLEMKEDCKYDIGFEKDMSQLEEQK